ncbi:precorrin-3B synthase [Nonomuraea longicatena]|uniref:Precorrin-3B synthase n=1 Tax=Nonomuraea longicatena TaxID=83682 RepID=A0ABN1NW13_9ACTN
MHQAADGPLARVRLPGGRITAAQLLVLAGHTEVVELTSRANVQVRALRSPTDFARRLADAGLLPSPSHERVRNIIASPLGGRGTVGVLDTDPLVEALDAALCGNARLAGLPGRFLFALDDGSGDVTALGADVTLVPAAGLGADVKPVPEAALDADVTPVSGVGLLLAGEDIGLRFPVEEAVALMIAAAEAFLDVRGPDGAWRIAELPDGPARVAARLRENLSAAGLGVSGDRWAPSVAGPDRGIRRAGAVGLRDGRVALEAVVPLGRLTAVQARVLAQVAESVRLTPWRTVVLLDLDPQHATDLALRLQQAGLVTDPDSSWTGVTACTGRPGCAKALADVQADAAAWVRAGRGGAGGGELPVHWAGCERLCGLPRGSVIQMVATPDGYQERQQ